MKHNIKNGRYFSLLLGLIATVLLFGVSCGQLVRGSGDIVTNSVEVANFNKISIEDGGNSVKVEISETGVESLIVEADDNIISHMFTGVQGNTLLLDVDNTPSTIIMPTNVRFIVTVKDIKSLDVLGGGNVVVRNLSTDDLQVNVQGSADVNFESLNVEDIKFDILGSGNVKISSGEATDQDINIQGSGNYTAGNFKSDIVTIKLVGSGDATVWANQTLDIDLTGSGDVSYYGSPRANIDTTGSGRVTALGAK